MSVKDCQGGVAATIDETHDPARTSWVRGTNGHHDFPIQNLPLRIFSKQGGVAVGGIAIVEQILDIAALSQTDLLEGDAHLAAEAASGETLNPLLALGTAPRRALR